jgi:hypothetical protein
MVKVSPQRPHCRRSRRGTVPVGERSFPADGTAQRNRVRQRGQSI